MKSVNYKVVALALAAGLLSACATTANKQVDEKLSQEMPVKNRASLSAAAKDQIESNSGLTTVQKASLLSLREATQKQMDEMQKESLKLRAVLIQEVLSPNYNPKEVAVIKSRMTKLDQKRTNVIFETVDQANKILGRDQMVDKDKIFERMFDIDREHGIY